MMRPFLTIRHPVLLPSRAFASRGSNRLHQTTVSRYADDNPPCSAHSGSAKNTPQTEIDNTVDSAKISRVRREIRKMDIKDVRQMPDTLQRPIYSYLLFKANWSVIRGHISLQKHRNNHRETQKPKKKLLGWRIWGYGSEEEMREMIDDVCYHNQSCWGAANHVRSIVKSPNSAAPWRVGHLLMISSISSRGNSLPNSSLS
jgi:hypothetical protein